MTPEKLAQIPTNNPFRAGHFLHYLHDKDSEPSVVLVEETPTMGRVCHSLKMGGTLQCGYADWSGIFLLTHTPEPHAS